MSLYSSFISAFVNSSMEDWSNISTFFPIIISNIPITWLIRAWQFILDSSITSLNANNYSNALFLSAEFLVFVSTTSLADFKYEMKSRTRSCWLSSIPYDKEPQLIFEGYIKIFIIENNSLISYCGGTLLFYLTLRMQFITFVIYRETLESL